LPWQSQIARVATLAAYQHRVDRDERYLVAAAVGLVGYALDPVAFDRAVDGELGLVGDVARAPDVGVDAVVPLEVGSLNWFE
jgi:hypothetical protein